MSEPLTVKEPFPTTDEIIPDAYSLRILSPAYAAPQGELTAVLQYIYHSFFFAKKGYKEIAETLENIAIAEMFHFKLLGKTILALGAPPVYSQYPPSCFSFYSTKYVTYSCSLRNMLEDDLLGERKAISDYERMLKCLKNEDIKNIISRILQDEKLHLEKLQSMLKEFKS